VSTPEGIIAIPAEAGELVPPCQILPHRELLDHTIGQKLASLYVDIGL
jgi:hypothetical protein